jgi:hypothetical protein
MSQGQSLLYVRFAVVEALRLKSDERKEGQGQPVRDRDRTPQDSPRDTVPTVSEAHGILPAAAYQRMIAE